MDRRRPGLRQRGAALWIVAAAVVMLAGLGLALAMTTQSTSRETRGTEDEIVVFYAAEGAVNEAYVVLAENGRTALDAMTYPRTLDGVSYSVHVTHGDADPALGYDLVRLVATAERRGRSSSVELLVRETVGTVVAASVFGEQGVVFDNDGWVDSYDSSLGSYTSQAVNTHGSNTYADALAPVGSNSDIDVENTAAVYGDAEPGPGGTTTVAGTAYVAGSTAPAASTMTLPLVTIPVLTSLGDLSLDASSVTLTPGSYRYDKLNVKNSGTLTIEGPATLVVDDATIVSQGSLVIDPTLGPVDIYVGHHWVLASQGTVRPQGDDPNDLAVYFAGDPHEQYFSDDTEFVGKVYAPEANIVIENSAEFWGAVVGRNVTISNGVKVHVDLNLSGVGTTGVSTFAHVSWRPLSPVQAEAITGP